MSSRSRTRHRADAAADDVLVRFVVEALFADVLEQCGPDPDPDVVRQVVRRWATPVTRGAWLILHGRLPSADEETFVCAARDAALADVVVHNAPRLWKRQASPHQLELQRRTHRRFDAAHERMIVSRAQRRSRSLPSCARPLARGARDRRPRPSGSRRRATCARSGIDPPDPGDPDPSCARRSRARRRA